jgi:hypothetical protein
MKATEKFSSVPLDPLIGSAYNYSVLRGGSKFQISSIIEGDLLSFSDDTKLFNNQEAYANSNSIAYVT